MYQNSETDEPCANIIVLQKADVDIFPLISHIQYEHHLLVNWNVSYKKITTQKTHEQYKQQKSTTTKPVIGQILNAAEVNKINVDKTASAAKSVGDGSTYSP